MNVQAPSPASKSNQTKAIGFFLIMLVGLVLLPSSAAGAATNGKIAFESNRDDDYEIYTMNADGSGQTNKSTNIANDGSPEWSPDGSRIAFASLRNGNMQIYVMHANGANPTNISNNSWNDWGPAWSPDGSKIAFWTDRDGHYQIYLMNADGSGQTNLSNNLANDYWPAWSPDGSTIIFMSGRDGNFQVYVMNADGSEQTNLSNNAANDYCCGRPAWAPDGSNIVFSSSRDGNFEIYTMNADGSDQTRLTINQARETTPAWSPDGTKIAFSSDRDGPCDPYGRCLLDVFIMNTDGSDQTNLSNSYWSDDVAPAWQPLRPRNYYWSWYDNLGGDNWVLMASPGSSLGTDTYSLSVGGQAMDISGFSGGLVDPGQAIAPRLDGVRGGPVVATLSTGSGGILSQRTLWPQGGGSLEEVAAIPEERLSDHYYWPWYDQQSPGFTDWILISNHHDFPVYYQIKIAAQEVASGSLAEGETKTLTFPEVMAGPVEVRAWSDQVEGAQPASVIASQRVLTGHGDAINESPGIPAAELSDHYLWAWYDGKSQGARNWVLLANPNAYPVNYTIKITGSQVATGTLEAAGDSQGRDKATPFFENLMGGPVEVTASGNIIASQRTLFGYSFEEVPGLPYLSLAASYQWAWYDNESPGARNWLLVLNPNPVPVSYTVKIAGSQVATGTLEAAGDSLGRDKATLLFEDLKGGPVEVAATGGNVISSQRVLWNGHLNEVTGMAPE